MVISIFAIIDRLVNDPNEYKQGMFVFVCLDLTKQSIEHEQFNEWKSFVKNTCMFVNRINERVMNVDEHK